MSEKRIITAIAAFMTAGTLIFSGCTAPKTGVEDSTVAKSYVKTVVKNLIKAAGDTDKESKTTDGKAGKEVSQSSKAEKNSTSSVAAVNKAKSKPADVKSNAVEGGLKKPADSAKDKAEENSAEKDAEPAVKETGAAENNAADGSEKMSEPDSACESSEAPGNNEPYIPEAPAESSEAAAQDQTLEPTGPAPESTPESAEPTPAPEPAASVHEHTWEENMELVHHEAVYGEPPLISPAQDITYDITEMHNICGICGANLDELGVEHDYMHAENGEGFWYYNDYIVVGQRTEHFDAVYGDPPLITLAYDEWVGTGTYHCTGCGATK